MELFSATSSPPVGLQHCQLGTVTGCQGMAVGDKESEVHLLLCRQGGRQEEGKKKYSRKKTDYAHPEVFNGEGRDVQAGICFGR